jgi:hypothetical protein
MSILRVRVNKYLPSEDGPPPQVYARITKIDERGRSVGGSTQLELVPISTREDQNASITVGSGAYLVEVRMPSGELLADSVSMAEGQDQELVLMAEASPSEWLSWQHLSGNVSASSASSTASSRPTQRAAPKPAARSNPRTRGLDTGAKKARGPMRSLTVTERATDLMQSIGLSVTDGLVRAVQRSNEVVTWASEEPASVVPSRPIYWLGHGGSTATQDFLREQPWQLLASLQGSTANIIAGLNAGRTDRVIEPSESDADAAVFRIPNEELADRSDYNVATRNYAAIHRRMGVELVCLPTPWRETWSGRDAVIEVGVQRPRYESEFASSVIVRDQQLAVLLGFLSSGALTSVKRLAQTGSSMLYEKSENPLAAAAGGFALVGSAEDAEPQPWHRWIENLMNNFEHIPDGAIQYATMRLRLRSSAQDVQEAARAFKVAYRRGLPFYGMGMRWLLEGLERVAGEDTEAQQMASDVRRLASRLHPQSPFTILRLGKR